MHVLTLLILHDSFTRSYTYKTHWKKYEQVRSRFASCLKIFFTRWNLTLVEAVDWFIGIIASLVHPTDHSLTKSGWRLVH